MTKRVKKFFLWERVLQNLNKNIQINCQIVSFITVMFVFHFLEDLQYRVRIMPVINPVVSRVLQRNRTSWISVYNVDSFKYISCTHTQIEKEWASELAKCTHTHSLSLYKSSEMSGIAVPWVNQPGNTSILYWNTRSTLGCTTSNPASC